MYRPSSGDGGFGTKVGGARTSFKPKRYATTCEPPTFVLEYGDDDLGLLRTRKFRLKKIKSDDSLERTVDEIVRKLPSRIDKVLVSKAQILRILQRLKLKLGGSVELPQMDGDLNKLSTEELDAVKDRMNDTFLANAKRPGDEGYQYDVQVEFDAPTEDNDWDSTDDDIDEDIPLP